MEQPRELFFPILSIHAEKEDLGENDEKYDDETFIHSLGEVLSHMLAEDFLSGSQGFYVDTVSAEEKYKLNNALYSLYSVLTSCISSQSNLLRNAARHPINK